MRRIQQNDGSDPIVCNPAAVEAIPKIRSVANQEPYLRTLNTRGIEAEGSSTHVRYERERRNIERGLYRELSRYYPRSKGAWTRPLLLSER